MEVVLLLKRNFPLIKVEVTKTNFKVEVIGEDVMKMTVSFFLEKPYCFIGLFLQHNLTKKADVSFLAS